MDIPRPSQRKARLKRSAALLVGLFLALMALGFAVQCWKDAHIPAPPGDFVSMGDRRVHYRVSGAGNATFVLEPGLGDYSGSWGKLEASLAQIGRVFVYDRAGLGWSDEGPYPRSPERIVTELHDVLAAANIPQPYILVGHSLGGLTQTLFATRYPDQVAGLLLIDPSHQDQLKKLPAPPALMTFLMTQLSRTAPFGLPQVLMRSSDSVASSSKHVRTAGAELRSFLRGDEPWPDHPLNLGRIPIYVLTAGTVAPIPDKSDAERQAIWQSIHDLHAQLASASSSPIRRHDVVAGATHYIHRTHPDIVINAARGLAARIESAAAAHR